jgi:hypothetical protein
LIDLNPRLERGFFSLLPSLRQENLDPADEGASIDFTCLHHRSHPLPVCFRNTLLLLLAGLAACHAGLASAAVIILNNRGNSSLSIRVGGGNISTVTFNVPAANSGSGTPITGSQQIDIRLVIRAPASNPMTGFLSVDSSVPLSNGAGDIIPLTSISWTASDGSIPSGSFNGTSNQLLASFPSSARITETHTFTFANDTLYDPGTYNGQITYTWSAP